MRDAKEEAGKKRNRHWREEAEQARRERKKGSREHPYRLGELPSGKCLPSNWTDFVSAMLLRRLNVTDDFEVTVVKPSYLRTVDALLARTSGRVVVNYFIWRIVDHVIKKLLKYATVELLYFLFSRTRYFYILT